MSITSSIVIGVICFSITSLVSLLTSLLLIQSIIVADYRQVLAFQGNVAAAKRIILPCYRPLLIFLVILYLLLLLFQSLMFISYKSYNFRFVYQILRIYSLCVLGILSIIPILLLQKSISLRSYSQSFFAIFPWWSTCFLLIFFIIITENLSFNSILCLELTFMFLGGLPPLFVSGGVLSGYVKSRIQLGSVSNRNIMELLLSFTVLFSVSTLIGVCCLSNSSNEIAYGSLSIYLVVITTLVNFSFPFAMYRSLLADTKFWRGLGKHNQGGLSTPESISNSDDNQRRSTMRVTINSIDLNVASNTVQKMMSETSQIVIDFAYIQVDRRIGVGSTSEVFCGRFSKILVAVKVATPPEITSQVIETFANEAKTCANMKHKNIVTFYGICVRPPQIGMVFELCEGGNLKSNLRNHADKWTSYLRLRACLNAAEAVAYLHAHGFIHRDLKAENFLVTRKMVIKLGDFGETIRKRNEESTKKRRMTVLGTISHMAPELIAGSRFYTEAVDIYALGFTFWEIWTGQDPYLNLNQFDIYKEVNGGRRPDLPSDAPLALNLIISKSWHQDFTLRPTAAEIVSDLTSAINELMPKQHTVGISLSLSSDNMHNNLVLRESLKERPSIIDISLSTSPTASMSNSLSQTSSTSSLSMRFTEGENSMSSVLLDVAPIEPPDPNNQKFFAARAILKLRKFLHFGDELSAPSIRSSLYSDRFWNFRRSVAIPPIHLSSPQVMTSTVSIDMSSRNSNYMKSELLPKLDKSEL